MKVFHKFLVCLVLSVFIVNVLVLPPFVINNEAEAVAPAVLVLTPAAKVALAAGMVACGLVFADNTQVDNLVTETWDRASNGLKQKIVDTVGIGGTFLGVHWNELIRIIRDLRQDFIEHGDILSRYNSDNVITLQNHGSWVLSTRDICVLDGYFEAEFTICGRKLDCFSIQTVQGGLFIYVYNAYPDSTFQVFNIRSPYKHLVQLSHSTTDVFRMMYVLGEVTIFRNGEVIYNRFVDNPDAYEGGQVEIKYRYQDDDSAQMIKLSFPVPVVIPEGSCTYDEVLDNPSRGGELEGKKVGWPIGGLDDILGKTPTDLAYDNVLNPPGVDVGTGTEVGWLENVYNGVMSIPARIAAAISDAFAINVSIDAELSKVKGKVQKKMVGFTTDMTPDKYFSMQDDNNAPKWYIGNLVTGQPELLIDWADYDDIVRKFKRWLGGIMIVLTLAACYRIIRVNIVID